MHCCVSSAVSLSALNNCFLKLSGEMAIYYQDIGITLCQHANLHVRMSQESCLMPGAGTEQLRGIKKNVSIKQINKRKREKRTIKLSLQKQIQEEKQKIVEENECLNHAKEISVNQEYRNKTT